MTAHSFHVNPTTGRVGRCRAARSCPFGGREAHYPTQGEAQAAYEEAHRALPPPVVRDELKEMDADALAQGLLQEAEAAGLSSEELSDALELASLLHCGQRRRNRGHHESTPYIEHPLRASYRLLKLGVRDREVLTAALLHDTVEDCSKIFVQRVQGLSEVPEATARKRLLSYISTRYGGGVAEVVRAVTNDHRTAEEAAALSPQEKNEQYLAHLTQEVTASPQAALVKLSDFIDNAGGLHHNDVPGFEKKVKKMAAKYLPCVEVFRREVSQASFPLPEASKATVLAQLARTEARLRAMGEKYQAL